MSLKLLEAIVDKKLKYMKTTLSEVDTLSIEESVDLQLDISSTFIDKYKEDITIDLSSHYDDEPFPLGDNRGFYFALDSIIPSYLSFYFRLFGAKNLDGQEALDRFNKLSKVFTHRMECHACGKNLALYFDFDTMTLKPVSEESCIFNSISKQHSMELDLSSGKLLIANDMRRLFGSDEEQDAIEQEFQDRRNEGRHISINNTLGRMLNTEMWAENDMMYFQTGNTSPNYYFNEEKNYFVFRDAFEEWEEYQDKAPDLDNLPFSIDLNNEKHLGSICTDLWAIHAMSMDTFKQLCKQHGLDEEEMIRKLNIKIHNVTKGIYQCTTYYETIEDMGMYVFHSIELKK